MQNTLNDLRNPAKREKALSGLAASPASAALGSTPFFSTVKHPHGMALAVHDSAYYVPSPVSAEFDHAAARSEEQLIALSVAYHDHHFSCAQCIAAGRGRVYASRCETGHSLFTAYQNFSLDGFGMSEAEGAARGRSSAAVAPQALSKHPDGNHGDNRRLQK